MKNEDHIYQVKENNHYNIKTKPFNLLDKDDDFIDVKRKSHQKVKSNSLTKNN